MIHEIQSGVLIIKDKKMIHYFYPPISVNLSFDIYFDQNQSHPLQWRSNTNGTFFKKKRIKAQKVRVVSHSHFEVHKVSTTMYDYKKFLWILQISPPVLLLRPESLLTEAIGLLMLPLVHICQLLP